MVWEWYIYSQHNDSFIESVYMTDSEFYDYVDKYNYPIKFTKFSAGSQWQK